MVVSCPTRLATLILLSCGVAPACGATGHVSNAVGAVSESPGKTSARQVNPPAPILDPAPTDPPAPPVPPAPLTPGLTDPGTDGDGNFVIGPTYQDAAEINRSGGTPRGKVHHFTMQSVDSKIFTGLDPTLSSQGQFTRDVWVYIPAQYKSPDAAPFMVVQDGGGYMQVPTVLDNMIAAKRLPVMIVILINPGPGDGRGSERGLEYDTVSDAYVNFIETEVLPRVSTDYGVQFTKDPEGRATMGGSSGGAAAFTMAWFRPDLYRRVLTYSGTFVNQHPDKAYPHGAWEYHEHLLADVAAKPLRVFLEVGQNDNNLDARFGDGMHDWVRANKAMADAMAAKKYHYRFLYAQGAGHVDGRVLGQTLPDALAWLWRGYPVN